VCVFLALPTKARIFGVFRFILEYSSFNGFWPLGNNNNRSIFICGFLKDDILAGVET